MIPTKLKLLNFTSYAQSPELDFTKFKMAAISGPNGAGKSSLLDAITWALWGTSRAGDSSDELVRLGQKEMEVEFSFELDQSLYKVHRKRHKKGGGSTSLEFWSGSHNLTEGTIKTTQEKITSALHLSYETFTNSAFLRQGHADEFTIMGPTDRKRILADILGLDHYDKLEEKAKEKIKEAQTKLQLLEYQLLELEAELSKKEDNQKNLSDAQKEVSKLDNEIKTYEAALKLLQKEKETLNIALKERASLEQTLASQKEELEQIKTQGLQRTQRIKQLEQSLVALTGLEEKLADLKNLQKQQEEAIKQNQQKLELEKLLSETQGKINLANQKKELIQREIDQTASQLLDLAKPQAVCPTCGQEIGKDKKHQILKELSHEKTQKESQLKLISTQKEEAHLNGLKLQLKNIRFDPQLLEKIQQQLKSLETLQTQKEQLLKNQASLATEKKTVSELRELFKKKAGNIKDLEEELKKLPQVFQQFLKISHALEEKERQLNNLREQQKGAQTILGQARQLISRNEQLEKLDQQKRAEKQALEKEKQVFEELALAFGKKGIQAMIIEAAIPEIEDESNRLLDRLTEGRMKVRLETQRETKTKVATIEGTRERATVETLDIIISDEMGERAYELYSIDGNELVYIRQNNQIKSTPIQELWQENKAIEHQGEYQLQSTEIEAICYVKGRAIWQKVDKILRHKSPNSILVVKCSPGNYTVRVTKNHSVYVLTSEGLKVKRTEDLEAGDFLLSPRLIPEEIKDDKLDLTNFITEDFLNKRQLNHKSLRWDDKEIWSRNDQKINRYIPINEKLAKLIGIAVAEGSGQRAYTISVGTSKALAKEVVQLSAELFGTQERSLIFVPTEYMERYIKNAPEISSQHPKAQYRPFIGGRLVAHIMKNMVGAKASLKKIPQFILNGSREIKLAFLKGLIVGDGYTRSDYKRSKSEVSITTISYRLTGELLFLCRQLGIWARVENHGDQGFRRGMNHQKSYRIVISGKKNLEILGIGTIASKYDTSTKYEGIPYSLVGVARKNSKRFQRGAENDLFNCGIQKVPIYAKESYLKIQDLVEDWNILEIKDIQEIKSTSEYVYDLTVPNNNSFVAGNGAILVHNSGGEAFRVNFALRLAISKLLTNRAGAKLQFLVIDEGFGTQDVQGRGRIVEVIDSIKDDFEKILIITHLDELKEEFPVRVEVSKNSGGSTFELVGA